MFFLQNTIETFTTRKETLSLKSKRYEHLWPVNILKRVKKNKIIKATKFRVYNDL